jgi:hypothetical protein
MYIEVQKGRTQYPDVFLDGKNISNICFAADDELGIAKCYKTNEDGSHVIENNDVVRIVLTGKVEFKEKPL